MEGQEASDTLPNNPRGMLSEKPFRESIKGHSAAPTTICGKQGKGSYRSKSDLSEMELVSQVVLEMHQTIVASRAI